MKPIQNQYQDLLEGKISKHNFLTNVKRSLPDYISNVTSFDDAVKILKNKRILSEVKSVVKEAIELEDIVSKYVKDADDIEKEMEAYHSKGYAGFSDMLKANLDRDSDFQSWVQKGHDEETLEKEIGESLNEDWGSSDQATFNKAIHKDLGEPKQMPMPFDPKFEAAVESAVDFWWDEWDEYASDRDGLIDHAKRTYYRAYFPKQFAGFQEMFSETKEEDDAIVAAYNDEQDAKHTLPGGHLREDVNIDPKTSAELDKVNPLEYNTGLDYELDLSNDFSAEGLQKAIKKVLKNLAKDQIYYTNLKASLTGKINKKQIEAAKQQEVKKDNQVDDLNQLKTLVKNQLANTKTTLTKKEKASSATPKGVKLMKEGLDNNSIANKVWDELQDMGTYSDADVDKKVKTYGLNDKDAEIVKVIIFDKDKEDMMKEEKFDLNKYNKDLFKKQSKEFTDKYTKPVTQKNTLKDKIKEYVTKQLKKEAIGFTVGGKEQFIKNSDASAYEQGLKNTGVKYTKRTVQ